MRACVHACVHMHVRLRSCVVRQALQHVWKGLCTSSALYADTRTVKRFSSEAYHRGVVIARCPGCDNQHLIADRLGWFGAPGSIDEFLAEQGQGEASYQVAHVLVVALPQCVTASSMRRVQEGYSARRRHTGAGRDRTV